MKRKIEIADYAGRIMEETGKGILLTTKAGDKVNSMTIGWGFLGIQWAKPIFVVLVRGSRYTKKMLEENPELYYKVLPYAQVLGVTDEWENKFVGILLKPPYWYVGPRMTAFDYVIINRSMRRSFATAMMRPQPKGGSTVGRSGGGGSFGGFGGGGFGGGGFGAR